MVLFFLLGVVIGGVGVVFTLKSIANFTDYNMYSRPLDILIQSPMRNYEFLSRENLLIKIMFMNHIIIMNLNDNTLTMFGSEGVVLQPHPINKQKIEYLFDKLIVAFKVEIYDNITTINNITISNNLIPKDSSGEPFIETYDNIPSLDEILEKIKRVGGVSGLTPTELKILKDFNN